MDSSQIMVITAPETPKSGRATTFHALCPAVSIATSSRKSLRRRHQSNNSQEKSRRQPRKSRRRLNGAPRRDCPLGWHQACSLQCYSTHMRLFIHVHSSKRGWRWLHFWLQFNARHVPVRRLLIAELPKVDKSAMTKMTMGTQEVDCAACFRPIRDRFILKVLDKPWHPACVRCALCQKLLDEKCFYREGKMYCRDDFYRYDYFLIRFFFTFCSWFWAKQPSE